jgi:hypothetical protein
MLRGGVPKFKPLIAPHMRAAVAPLAGAKRCEWLRCQRTCDAFHSLGPGMRRVRSTVANLGTHFHNDYWPPADFRWGCYLLNVADSRQETPIRVW